MKTPSAELLAPDTISERSIKIILKRLNGDDESRSEALAAIKGAFNGEPKRLEAAQVEKGRAWLVDQWKTPRGVERKNNPFGARETEALDDFEGIDLEGFIDAGGYQHRWYVPLYRVHGRESMFEYYLAGGSVVITG